MSWERRVRTLLASEADGQGADPGQAGGPRGGTEDPGETDPGAGPPARPPGLGTQFPGRF